MRTGKKRKEGARGAGRGRRPSGGARLRRDGGDARDDAGAEQRKRTGGAPEEAPLPWIGRRQALRESEEDLLSLDRAHEAERSGAAGRRDRRELVGARWDGSGRIPMKKETRRMRWLAGFGSRWGEWRRGGTNLLGFRVRLD